MRILKKNIPITMFKMKDDAFSRLGTHEVEIFFWKMKLLSLLTTH